jgi:hypothetical protein
MAAQQAPDAEPTAAEHAMLFERFNGIGRTARLIAAVLRDER